MLAIGLFALNIVLGSTSIPVGEIMTILAGKAEGTSAAIILSIRLPRAVAALVLGVIVCFGYNFFYFEYKLPNGATAQILDILDYVSNNILMPIVSIATCILIGWILKPKTVIDEATKNGEKFGRKGLYIVMVKFIAPAFLIILLLISSGILS